MDFSLYIHYPFCLRKCHYCAFASIPVEAQAQNDFHQALLRELIHRSAQSPWAGGTVTTLYFGGGTPSLAPVDFIAEVIAEVRARWNLAADAEITLEANPTTAETKKFRAFREAGINRLSMGAQSFDDGELQMLGRTHNSTAIGDAVRFAREAGFDNISLDLIYGAPGMTIENLSRSVDKFLELNLEHLSTYSLSIEPNTHFARIQKIDPKFQVDQDRTADQFGLICKKMKLAGYEHYELTNFSRPGKHSRHNYNYWLRTPFLGLGVSAHSFDGRRRFWNNPNVAEYNQAILKSHDAVAGSEDISAESERDEIVYLGLRCREGLSVAFASENLHTDIMKDLLSQGVLFIREGKIHVLEHDWLLLDEIALRLLDG